MPSWTSKNCNRTSFHWTKKFHSKNPSRKIITSHTKTKAPEIKDLGHFLLDNIKSFHLLLKLPFWTEKRIPLLSFVGEMCWWDIVPHQQSFGKIELLKNVKLCISMGLIWSQTLLQTCFSLRISYLTSLICRSQKQNSSFYVRLEGAGVSEAMCSAFKRWW